MTRTRRGYVAKKRRKKIMELAKGFKGSQSKLFRTSNQRVMKALYYSFSDRRKKKNQIRSVWISRINAKFRSHKIQYHQLMKYFKQNLIMINKKNLSEISIYDYFTHTEIINKILK